MAGIGLIVTDAQIVPGPQPGDQRHRQPLIQMTVEHPHLPRARRAALQARREGMDRRDHRIALPRRQPGKGGVIGAVKAVQPPFRLFHADRAVGRNDRAVIQFHYQRRVILAPVRVDHQPREARPDHRAVQEPPQLLRDTPGAHIPGDVARHVRRPDSQGAARNPRRHRVRGMVTGDQPAPRTGRTLDLIRLIHVALRVLTTHGAGFCRWEGDVLRWRRKVSANAPEPLPPCRFCAIKRAARDRRKRKLP